MATPPDRTPTRHAGTMEHALRTVHTAPYRAYARVYDRHGQSAWSEVMVAFTLGILPRYQVTGHRALDLACGTGAAALRFAEAGYTVTGIDNAPAMITQARRKTRAVKGAGAVRFRNGDVRTFTFPTPIDLVTCFYDSLNYLTDPADLVRAFTRIRAVLAPGGLLVADMNTRAGLAADWNDQCRTRVVADTYFVEQTTWNGDTAIGTLTLTGFVPENGAYRCFEETHRERGYTVAEISAALAAAGLTLRDLFACDRRLGPTLSPPDDATHRVVLVASADHRAQ